VKISATTPSPTPRYLSRMSSWRQSFHHLRVRPLPRSDLAQEHQGHPGPLLAARLPECENHLHRRPRREKDLALSTRSPSSRAPLRPLHQGERPLLGVHPQAGRRHVRGRQPEGPGFEEKHPEHGGPLHAPEGFLDVEVEPSRKRRP
jgi:hypothetical protein